MDQRFFAGLFSGKGELEDRPDACRVAAPNRCPVERPAGVEQVAVRVYAVAGGRPETIEHLLLAGCCDREDRAVAFRAAGIRRTVERPIYIDESAQGGRTIGYSGEAMQDGFRSPRRYRKDDPLVGRAARGRHPVQRASDVGQAGIRRRTVRTPLERVDDWGVRVGRDWAPTPRAYSQPSLPGSVPAP